MSTCHGVHDCVHMVEHVDVRVSAYVFIACVYLCMCVVVYVCVCVRACVCQCVSVCEYAFVYICLSV